jgi:hypothetical protein
MFFKFASKYTQQVGRHLGPPNQSMPNPTCLCAESLTREPEVGIEKT